jgi:Xaa-Pro aminopeptidase
VIHYHATERTDAPLRPRGIYLVDSGAQYVDGTTDITRTVLLGAKATRGQKEHFTRVLKGHIALAQAKFPAGVKGARLDALARLPLWEAGLDYNHGTGHGVGSYLNVHEGPQSISPHRWAAELEAGNVQSNEPGYYLEGRYGIRIENLILVVEEERLSGDELFLGFETLTLCPIDRRLIDAKLLSRREREWLDHYHRRVYRTLARRLRPSERNWLRRACAAL